MEQQQVKSRLAIPWIGLCMYVNYLPWMKLKSYSWEKDLLNMVPIMVVDLKSSQDSIQ